MDQHFNFIIYTNTKPKDNTKSPVAELSHLVERVQVEALGDLGVKQDCPSTSPGTMATSPGSVENVEVLPERQSVPNH